MTKRRLLILGLLFLAVCIACLTIPVYSDAEEPQEAAAEEFGPQVTEFTPMPELPVEAATEPPEPIVKRGETPATDYSSLDGLEYVGTFTATAYCPCVTCCGIWSAEHPDRIDTDYIQRTASGTEAEAGRTIAADWDVLPEGTVVVIKGHPYTVEDTGNAIKGNRIDIFMESHEAALEWGVREVEVYKERIA